MFQVESCLYRYGRPNACHSKIVGRGLCRSHYVAVALLVRNGLVTWEELERLGKVFPARSKPGHKFRGPIPTVREWFLSSEPVFPVPGSSGKADADVRPPAV